MLIRQVLWTDEDGWRDFGPDAPERAADLVLYVAAPAHFRDPLRIDELKARFPGAPIAGCSTGGEILGGEVYENSVAASAVWFDDGAAVIVSEPIDGADQSEPVGARAAKRLDPDGLKGVLVLSDGTRVNGTGLVRGLQGVLATTVPIAGGLAGDGTAFQSTFVDCNAGAPASGRVALIGLYGPGIGVLTGSFGGWVPFGPERRVTRAHDNVLEELDNEPALDLYKRYLGEEAERLPASALLFPLRLQTSDGHSITRTVLGVDEERKTMTFAGDIPKGAVVQLMRSTIERLIDGAEEAAMQITGINGPCLSVLVSCIGRHLVMGQHTVEEVKVVADHLGPDNRQIGFYSYGELSPSGLQGRCELHNQTMTVVTVTER
ncbi:MAG: FIST C-terminal domain-containing protein [Alphaproteobacteria bacterium]|nr:FIST C-terminal domain-containing protein [Alphaproteobacteria bacterium]